MKVKQKSRSFLAYSLDILSYKKLITTANVFCNAVIFSHQAAINFCVMQILNSLEKAQGFAFNLAIPYLFGILVVALIRVSAIMGCASLDALRSYYYQNRVRTNTLRLLLKKDDITQVAGHSGSIFEVLDNDIPTSTFPAELLTEVTGYFIYTLIALGMLLSVNWQLTLFIFLPLSAAIYGIQRLSQRMKERRRENRAAHDAVSSFIGDISDAALAIKAAGTEQSVLNRYDSVNKNRRSAFLKDTLFNEKIGVMLHGAVYAGSAIMMFAASRLMTNGTFGIGDFSLFIANLGTVANCVERIVELAAESRRAEVSYERILNVVGEGKEKELNVNAGIKIRPDLPSRQRQFNPTSLKSFEIKNLSFDYGDGNGFDSVSFKVNPGELTVVAGGVGSGKSTLLSVLMGLFLPDGGELLLDGKAIKLQELEPINISGAPQRGGFFSKDLRENICLGFPASQDDVERVLSIAVLDELFRDKTRGQNLDRQPRGQAIRRAAATISSIPDARPRRAIKRD